MLCAYSRADQFSVGSLGSLQLIEVVSACACTRDHSPAGVQYQWRANQRGGEQHSLHVAAWAWLMVNQTGPNYDFYKPPDQHRQLTCIHSPPCAPTCHVERPEWGVCGIMDHPVYQRNTLKQVFISEKPSQTGFYIRELFSNRFISEKPSQTGFYIRETLSNRFLYQRITLKHVYIRETLSNTFISEKPFQTGLHQRNPLKQVYIRETLSNRFIS